jgi:hypothetical protein
MLNNEIPPNKIIEFQNFYVSQNNQSFNYESETTAIVFGQMQLFFILNGDHFDRVLNIAKDFGMQGVIDYFIKNIDETNKYSEHLSVVNNLKILNKSLKDIAIELIGFDNVKKLSESLAPKVIGDENALYS